MGIITRFKEIMESNINDLLDKMEDPSKMVDQTLRNLREELAEVKKETAGVMADAKAARKRVEECQAEIRKFSLVAENAVRAGKDDDARTLLARKQELMTKFISLTQTAELAEANEKKMRQMYEKLSSDIASLESRKDSIKAKDAAAKAQERINRMTAGTDTTSSMEAFDRMEAKTDKRLESAMAEAQLNEEGTPADKLLEQYTSGASSTAVDDELAALKAKLGM